MRKVPRIEIIIRIIIYLPISIILLGLLLFYYFTSSGMSDGKRFYDEDLYCSELELIYPVYDQFQFKFLFGMNKDNFIQSEKKLYRTVDLQSSDTCLGYVGAYWVIEAGELLIFVDNVEMPLPAEWEHFLVESKPSYERTMRKIIDIKSGKTYTLTKIMTWEKITYSKKTLTAKCNGRKYRLKLNDFFSKATQLLYPEL